jgi:DNA-binding GntR family transcriptional regulator
MTDTKHTDNDELGYRSAVAQRRSHSLTDLVRKELERIILSGELKAGERLNEQALATRLGVSRGPVREAARALERAGLVTTVINHGFFVRELSKEETEEIYDMRSLLFGFACARLATTLTQSQAQELEALARAMETAAEEADGQLYYTLNLQFHSTIFAASGHQRVAQSYTSLLNELHLARRRTLVSAQRMKQSSKEHRQLLAALKKGDALKARELAEKHIQGGKQRWASMRAADEKAN